jgi:two-component system OmpR family response regulator
MAPLNPAEYALLRQLLDHPHRVVSRDELLQELAGRDAEAFDRTIDLRVNRLRRRLGDDARAHLYPDDSQRGSRSNPSLQPALAATFCIVM